MKTLTKQFPVQKTGAPVNEPRRGANNKRLTCSESELVSFAAPIAGQKPEAHETSEPTRDGEGVPKVLPCSQLPGCLPPGADLDTLLTPEEFCTWQRCGRNWFSARKHSLAGVINHSRDMVRIHPRTYLEKSAE